VAYGSVLQFWLLLSSIILLALYEFYRLLEVKGIKCFTWLGLGLGMLLNIACLMDDPHWFIAVNTLSVVACLIYALGPGTEQSLSLPAIAGTLLGLFYIAWLLNYLLYLRRLPQGRGLVMLLFFIIWAGDSGAYYVGRRWGRHKLAPRISPAKTIEGAAGGLLLSLGTILSARIWLPELSIIEAILLGLGIGIVAQVSDLGESQIKRWAEVKDTGSLIPGHGGLLDRLDSLLFAAPVFYYCTKSML
jgi:phosphatidate cytidylyltransferase